MSIPIPTGFQRGTVAWKLGHAGTAGDLEGARGTVHFQATAVAVQYANATALPKPVKTPIVAGVMTPVALIVNDPEVWNWKVSVHVGVEWEPFHIDVPANGVNLATAAVVPGKGPVRALHGPQGDAGAYLASLDQVGDDELRGVIIDPATGASKVMHYDLPRGPEGPYGGTEVTDPQVASMVADSGTATRGAVEAVADRKLRGLGFAEAQNISSSATSFRVFEQVAGDLLAAPASGGAIHAADHARGPWSVVADLGATGGPIVAIRDAGDGELLVARADYKVYKTRGWGTGTVTSDEVLATTDIIAEYGFDVDPVSGWAVVTNYSGSDMTTSRYLWLSQDHGETWQVIHDMTTAYPAVDPVHSHCHVAALDTYHSSTTPRIWHTFHKTVNDPTNAASPFARIIYSDDAGQTWTTLSTDFIQPVVGVATERGMIFDTDKSPNALYMVPRGTMQMEKVWEQRETVSQPGWAIKAVRGAAGAVHILFRSVVAGIPAIMVSTDGWRFNETLTIPAASPADTVDVTGMGIDAHGGMIAAIWQSATGSGSPRNPLFDEPLRGQITVADTTGLNGGDAASLGVAGAAGAVAGVRGVALGVLSRAADFAASLGYAASAALNGTALGYGASAGEQSTALGESAEATGQWSVAVGRAAKATGQWAIAIGRLANASHSDAIAVGMGATSTASSQVALGSRHVELRNSPLPTVPAANAARVAVRTTARGLEMTARFPNGRSALLAAEDGAVQLPVYTGNNRPPVAVAGDVVLDQHLGKPIVYDGSKWVDFAGAAI